MFHARYFSLRPVRCLIQLALVALSWAMMAGPALAQGEEGGPVSALEELYKKPDLVAPLVVPMILTLGGVLTLMAFLAWIYSHMPSNSQS